jgi:hypothetical protein
MSKEAMKLALKRAFQLGQDYWYQADHEFVSQNKKSDETRAKFEQLIDDTCQALAKQEQGAPVNLAEYDAGLLNDYGGGNVGWWWDYIRYELGRAHDYYQEQVSDLYTTPQQRTWVGLTDEEINLFINGRGDEDDDDYVEPTGDGFGLTDADLVTLVRRSEVKLKEKNT